jgi:hypothetical protein
MKYFPLILILTLAFAVSAQTNQTSDCPTVDVSGGGVPLPGELVSFTASVDTKGRTDLQIEYIWTVSSGKIIYGQGTPTITIEPNPDENITATVEIKGFPEGCRNTASETMSCGLRPPAPIKIGEFLNLDTPNEKTQLEDLKKKIIDNPNAQIYVVGRFKENTSEKKVAQKLKKIGGFLMKSFTLDADRITIIRVFGELEYTEIWIVPPGAANPQIR